MSLYNDWNQKDHFFFGPLLEVVTGQLMCELHWPNDDISCGGQTTKLKRKQKLHWYNQVKRVEEVVEKKI